MSDTSVSSVAGDADTPNSSDNEVLHDNVKKAINTFLHSDSDCGSSDGMRTPPRKKAGRSPIETIRDAGSQSERTEVSADDARDIASEDSRGSGLPQSDDESRHRSADRLSARSESDNDDACSDVSTRSRKSEKDVKPCQKPLYSERKSGYDNSKLLHGKKSTADDGKSCHSGQSRGGSSKKAQHDGSRQKTHQDALLDRSNRKSFDDVGRQLSGSEKSFREKVKAGVQDRRTPSDGRGAKSLAVNVRDASSEDSRMSVLSANSAFSSSCRGKVADTLSIASKSSSDERASPCDSTSSHDLSKLQRKDLKMSSNSERKSRPDVATSHHTTKSCASVDRSRDKSHDHDKKSHSSQSKSRVSGLDFSEKKLHPREKGPPGSALKQPPGREKPPKRDDVVTKTSKSDGRKAGTKARSATRKTAETDMSADDFLSETSRTSDLWAGFALGDWGHGRAADRPSIASKSDPDEASSHCGSAASIEKLPTKERRKSSNAEAKSSHGGKKSRPSDESHDSDRKSTHGGKSHVTDKKKKSYDSSSDRSQVGGKSVNSSRKQSPETKKQAVKDESGPNTGALQKSPRGISFFSSTKTTPSSTYKTPNVNIPTTPVVTTHVWDSPPVFTKVKINGFRVFVDKALRADHRLWQHVDVSLVNCDHVVAASLAKQREISARKKEDNFSSPNASSSREDKQKTLHKGKRENQNDAAKTLVNKHTHSKNHRQSDNHVQKKSFDKMQFKGSGDSKQSNNRKGSKDPNKKFADRSKSPGESRSPENSINRFPLTSSVHCEKKSHISRKSLHESKSQNSIKSKRESESSSSSESLQSESNISSKSQHEIESNKSSKLQRESESNKSIKLQRESESSQSGKSQREKESNKSSKSQWEGESNQNSKSQSERESSLKSQHEKESNSSSKPQRESESNKISKSKVEGESSQSGKSQREKESNSSSKSQCESESNQNSKAKSEWESSQSGKSQHEKESNSSSKPQRERESSQYSKPQSERESNQSSKSQREKESSQNSKSRSEKKSNQNSKLQPERRADESSKSQSESHSNHRSKSQQDSKSQPSSKSHSKIKSGDSNRTNHDSKSSSSHESKSLGRPVLHSTELRQSPSGSLVAKEHKVKESKAQSGIRTEDSLHDKSKQDSRKKITADINAAAQQSKPAKKKIIVFQSDSEDEDNSTIDVKENIEKKEHQVLNEDPEPACDSSTHGQIVANDLDLLNKDESSKDDIPPGEEQRKNAEELKADDANEEHPDVTDGSSSLHDDKVETADVKRVSSDADSASVKDEVNDASAAGLTEGLVTELEVESEMEISVSSSDSSLQLCKSEEDSAADLEDVNKKPVSDNCSDLTKPEEVEESSVCQTTRGSDMSDKKDVDQDLQVKDSPVVDLEVSKASGVSELDNITSDGSGKDSVTVGQDSGGGGDCATPRERQSSVSDNGPVISIEHASSIVSVEPAVKAPGAEPATKVCVKLPLVVRSYNVEQAKKDIRLQPFVKLKVLDELVLKKLLADWEYSVRKKSQDAAAGKAVSNIVFDDSASHSRSSSCASSSGRSEVKDRFVEKNLPPARDKDVQEKKKRTIPPSDDVSAGEPPVRRLKVEGDVKSEQQSNSERKKETSNAPSNAPLPETIAKSLQKAKAEFKRKGGFPSDMVRDGDAKKRKKDADKAVANMEDWMHGGGGRDKKNMNSLSFVIPKVKSGQKPEKVKKKKKLSEEVWLPPPVAIPVPRTPRPAPPPKTLTEEDKGRSVLAKLEDSTVESKNMRWQTNESGYRGTGVIRASTWRPLGSVEERGKRFGGQEGVQWRTCSPAMPPRDAMNGSTSFPRFQRWNTPGPSSNVGTPRNPSGTPFSSSLNTPRLPTPSRWQGPQQPIPTVITNLKAAGPSSSSSENWVRLYNRDPLRLEDPSAADECSAAFSPPAVADDDDDDDGVLNDQNLDNTPRKMLADDSDNMVESVTVLAEAIQEVLVAGTISSGRRDKLVDIYAKLQRNLNLTTDSMQGNNSLLNALYSSTDQTLMSVDMFKDLLQQGSTSSQPENATGSLPSATNEIARNDLALMAAARDLDLRDGIRAAMGYQDVDHRRMDGRCNAAARGFEQMMLSASTPSSSLASPRGPPVIGKSDTAYGSLLLATTGGAPGASALYGNRGFRIDPNATFMDIDERNKCSKDIDERNAWMRTAVEREPVVRVAADVVKGVPANLGASCDSIVPKPDSLRPNAASGVDARQTVSAEERTLGENPSTPIVSGSPGIKPLEKTEVVVVVPKSKEVLRQEAVASRIEDELQLLEMLVTIQCELGEVSPVPEASSETTVAADAADPTPAPEAALNTSDTVPSGVSSVISSSPACATVGSIAGEDESQDSATQLSGKDTPQQKVDDEQKAAANAKTIEDRVISLARNALKPFYHKSLITSEEFKLIMRKTIAKIKVREGEELKESKVPQLINAYVESIIRRRKKVTL